jgi:hypothetical protein
VISKNLYVYGTSDWFVEKFDLINNKCKRIKRDPYKYGLVIEVEEIIWDTFNGDQELIDVWAEKFLFTSFKTKSDDHSFMKFCNILEKWKILCENRKSEDPCRFLEMISMKILRKKSRITKTDFFK